MSKIETAETFYRGNDELNGIPVAEWAFVRHPSRELPERRPVATNFDVQAYAYVNHGRWIVDCPFCPSAQVASMSDPRFFCAGADGCANAAAGGHFVPVVFPGDKQLKAIERELLKRRNKDNRNWHPGEKVSDLQRENKQRGVDDGDAPAAVPAKPDPKAPMAPGFEAVVEEVAA